MNHAPTPNQRIASCGGDELPEKMERFKNPIEITQEEYRALKDESKGYYGMIAASWGSVINNPCELYAAKDGRIIEVHCSFGWLYRYFTEALAKAGVSHV